MGRHRKIPKKNRKKLKSVDPFNKNAAAIKEAALRGRNVEPTKEDEQPLPRALVDIQRSQTESHTFPTKKRIRNRLVAESQKAGFEIRRWESEGALLRRIATQTHNEVQDQLTKAKFGVAGRDAKEVKEEFAVLDEKARRRKEQKLARREKLKKLREKELGIESEITESQSASTERRKKGAGKDSRTKRRDEVKRSKREELDADRVLNSREVIRFGERVDAPPEFHAEHRKTLAPKFAKAGKKELLLKKLFKGSAKVEDSEAPAEIPEKREPSAVDRQKVIEAYRAMKKRRLASSLE